MLTLSIENIEYTNNGAAFDVVARADAQHAFDTYGVKLNALELLEVGDLHFTVESNVIPGFQYFDTNLNTKIAEENGSGRGPGSDTIGFHAFHTGGGLTLRAGVVLTVARFAFQAPEWFPSSQVVLAFVTRDHGMDTGFARLGNDVPYTANSATFSKAPLPPPTPQLTEDVAVLHDASGSLFVRFNGRTERLQ